MSDEIGLVYMNLSHLLDDICLFLRESVNKDVFTAESQKYAETLIKRSKIQLQQISNITNDECYMQMDEKEKVEEEDDEEDLIYMDAIDEKEIPVEVNDVCPFAGVPARNLPIDDKCGYIYMKTKFIFGFEKLKRIYAILHKDWFLIYNSDKDSKPCYTYCLRNHEAHMIPTTKQGEHETQLFALTNRETKQKSQFLAQTHKDMLQWITRINKYDHKDDRQPMKTEPQPKIETVTETQANSEEQDEEEDETYDMVVLKVESDKTVEAEKEDEEEDEIYEVIRPQQLDQNHHIPMPKPMDIPIAPTKQQQKPLPPLPPLPTDKEESTESLESYDEIIPLEKSDKQSNISGTSSFSEEEEELQIYDVLVATSPSEQEVNKGRASFSFQKKEEMGSPFILSLKEKLMQSSAGPPQKEKPLTQKRLSFDQKFPISMINSPTKENRSPIAFPMRKPSNSATPNDPQASAKGALPKPGTQPKPSFLTKPKIDVKIIKPSVTKSSTKQVMKLAKEISLK